MCTVCRGNVIQLCVHGPERILHSTVLTWMATVPSASSCKSASAIKVCSCLCCGRFSYRKTILQVEIQVKLSLDL